MVASALLRYAVRYCYSLLINILTRGLAPTQMRLQSTIIFMPLLVAATIGYGWVCEHHINVAAICVLLFLAGFSMMSVTNEVFPVLCIPR